MSDVIETPPIVFRRVELADIDAMGSWLFPRVREAFPNATDAMIRSFLVQAHFAPDQWCGRTRRSCAVAYVEPGIMGSPPLVRVVFSFGAAGIEDSKEVAELYAQIGLWALRMNALGIEISPWNDADRIDIRKALWRIRHDPSASDFNAKAEMVKLAKADRYFWLTAPQE